MVGKKMGDDDLESEDVNVPIMKRLAPWLRRLPIIMGVSGATIFAVYKVVWFLTGGYHEVMQEVQPFGSSEPQTEEVQPTASPVAEGSEIQTIEQEKVGNDEKKEEPPEPEKKKEEIRAVTSRYVITTEDQYSLYGVPSDLRDQLERFLSISGKRVFSEIGWIESR